VKHVVKYEHFLYVLISIDRSSMNVTEEQEPAPSYLDSLPYYDNIRLNLTRSGVYNLSRSEDSKLDWLERVGNAEDEEPVALCHIASMGSLTLGRSYPHVSAYEELTAMGKWWWCGGGGGGGV
jgi:hypothetical protein